MYAVPHWAIAYSTNSRSPRAQKWYRVVRVIFVDGKWWELYWNDDVTLRGKNRTELYNTAKARMSVMPGVFSNPETPHSANELRWSLTGTHWTRHFERSAA
jgi:hypothetical protein